MKKSNYEMMELPKKIEGMSEEEMVNIVGGSSVHLEYKLWYANRYGANACAASIKKEKGWSNISQYDLTAEIYAHAFAYYNTKNCLLIAKSLGYGDGIVNSLLNGIDVENKLDTRTYGGVKLYQLYRAIYVATA